MMCLLDIIITTVSVLSDICEWTGTFFVFAACHTACAGSCLDNTPATCESCKDGWVLGDSGCEGRYMLHLHSWQNRLDDVKGLSFFCGGGYGEISIQWIKKTTLITTHIELNHCQMYCSYEYYVSYRNSCLVSY